MPEDEQLNWMNYRVDHLTQSDVDDSVMMDFMEEEMKKEIIDHIPEAESQGTFVKELLYQIDYNDYTLWVEWRRTI